MQLRPCAVELDAHEQVRYRGRPSWGRDRDVLPGVRGRVWHGGLDGRVGPVDDRGFDPADAKGAGRGTETCS